MLTIDSIDALHALAAQGPITSGWMVIDQPTITAFGELTGDRAWIHLDAQRAALESPFGTTIAHGLLSLSMLPALLAECVSFENAKAGVNYGFDRIRFTAPVPNGSRVRGVFKLQRVEEIGLHNVRIAWDVELQVDGASRPALIAHWLFQLGF